jgi:hypothetical protein
MFVFQLRFRTLGCMPKLILSAALILLTATDSWADPATSQLTIAVEPALAEIDPRPPGPRTIQLPQMTFALRIDALCGAGMRAASASVSISDTRRSLGPEQLGDLTGTELTIRVPQKQLAPLTIENFCFSDIAVGENDDLYIADALSAQVSLRCVGENQHSIIYRVAPLDIALRCRIRDD